jgi:hypothetical protein
MTKKMVLLITLLVTIIIVFSSCGLLSVGSGNFSSSGFFSGAMDSDNDSDSGFFEDESIVSPPQWILGTWNSKEMDRTAKFTTDNIILRSASIENFAKKYGNSNTYKLDEETIGSSIYVVYVNNISTGQNPTIYKWEKLSDSVIKYSGGSNGNGIIFFKE